MDEKCCIVLAIILCLMVISESKVIVRRALSEDESFRNAEIPLSINPLEKEKKLGLKPEILSRPADDYYDYESAVDPIRRPSVNDYDGAERGVDKIDNRFPSDREWSERPQGNPKEKDDTDKLDDDNFNKSLDEEDSDKPGSNDKDWRPSFDEDSPVHKDRDESEVEYTVPKESEEKISDKEYIPEEEEKPGEERKEENDDREHRPEEEEKLDEERKDEEGSDDKEHVPEEKEKPVEEGGKEEDENDYKEHELEEDDEEEKHEHENDDKEHEQEEDEKSDEEKKENDYEEEMPKEDDEEAGDHDDDDDDDKDDKSISQDGDSGSPKDGSVFDTPFFNLEQVKKYFGKLDKALGHAFRDTADQALMLNDTYANTTEEEVDIAGRKYIITKSLIKGGDNNSAIYVEALSAKPKINDTKVIEDVKNVTHS